MSTDIDQLENQNEVVEKVEAAPSERSYYSASQGLYICISVGSLKEVAGQTVRLGEKAVQFGPTGRDKFGVCRVTDPDVIAFLDRRVAEVGDIFGEEEYQRRAVPAEDRARVAQRRLEEANSLIRKLQAENEALKTKKK
jgi:hypothetical protein